MRLLTRALRSDGVAASADQSTSSSAYANERVTCARRAPPLSLCLLFILQCSRGFLINLRTDSNEGEVEVGRKSTASTYPNGKPGTGGILPFLDMLRAREASGGLFDGCDCR